MANTKQNKPAIATVVNFGVSFLHLRVTENTEKPIEDASPKIKPIIEFFSVFPVKKNEVSKAILSNPNNLIKIVKIVHLEVKKKMYFFLRKNKNAKIVILDIPLFLENKINKKNDILVFVESKKKDIFKRLKKRKNYNPRLLNKFRNIQLSLDYKKKKSQFIIKNDFTRQTIKKNVNNILSQIL